MKKLSLLISVSLLVFALSFFSFSKCKHQTSQDLPKGNEMPLIEDLIDYERGIQEFPCEKTIAPIHSKSEAINAAKILWDKDFCDDFGRPYDSVKGFQIEAFYVSEKDIWVIYGFIKQVPGTIMLYETPVAAVKSDGEVLALWFD